VGKPRWGRIAVAGGAAAAALVIATSGWPESHDRPAASGSASGIDAGELPHAPRPAFAPGRPVPLRRGGTVFRWAPVLRPVTARRAPSAASRAVARLDRLTPEHTTNLVLVVDRRPTPEASWVRVRLPVLPSNRTAWVPRRDLGGYHFVHSHLVVDLARLEARLLLDGRAIFRAPVGVGLPQWPTPRGRFYIRDELTDFASPFYGPLAFGTSARSAVLTDWPDGGFVGIHGTDRPDLIPGRVSHGCIRLRNPDIRRLARLMPVGTPLTIE
jgi:L,D-transpeptidase catalytic domain